MTLLASALDVTAVFRPSSTIVVASLMMVDPPSKLIVPELGSMVAPPSIRRPDSVPSPFATIMSNSVPLSAIRAVARLLAVICVVAFPSTI